MSISTHVALAALEITDDAVLRIRDTLPGGCKMYFPVNEADAATTITDYAGNVPFTVNTIAALVSGVATRLLANASPTTGDVSEASPGSSDFIMFSAGYAVTTAAAWTFQLGADGGNRVALNFAQTAVEGADGEVLITTSGFSANTTDPHFLCMVGNRTTDIATLYAKIGTGAMQTSETDISSVGAITFANTMRLSTTFASKYSAGGIVVLNSAIPSDIAAIVADLATAIMPGGTKKLPVAMLTL